MGPQWARKFCAHPSKLSSNLRFPERLNQGGRGQLNGRVEDEFIVDGATATPFSTSMVKSSNPAWSTRPARLILFHGLASTSREFGFLTHPLRRNGLRLQAPEVPGYSASLFDEEASWQDWVASGANCLDRLEAESPEPYVLGGLCTGAMLALAIAAQRPRAGLRGLALLSPLFSYDGWALPWWYSLRPLAYATGITRLFSMREREPYGVRNERMRQLIRAQLAGGETSLAGPARVPLRVVRESERLSAHARTLLSRLVHPVQVQHAREDEICRLASVRDAVARVPTGLLSLHVLENSYHMITADNDRHLVADRLSAFLQGLDTYSGLSESAACAQGISSVFDVAEAATAS